VVQVAPCRLALVWTEACQEPLDKVCLLKVCHVVLEPFAYNGLHLNFVADDVWLLFPPFTTAFLLLTASVQQHGSFCSSSITMLHCGAGLTMQAGPSLDRGLPGTSGQGLPAQGMLYCAGALLVLLLMTLKLPGMSQSHRQTLLRYN